MKSFSALLIVASSLVAPLGAANLLLKGDLEGNGLSNGTIGSSVAPVYWVLTSGDVDLVNNNPESLVAMIRPGSKSVAVMEGRTTPFLGRISPCSFPVLTNGALTTPVGVVMVYSPSSVAECALERESRRQTLILARHQRSIYLDASRKARLFTLSSWKKPLLEGDLGRFS